MEGKYAKVLDNGLRVVELKRERASRFATLVARSAIPQLSAYKSSAVKLGKRKKPDVCKAKCKSCKLASHRSLARYYANFMKSGLPKRLLFFQNGEWIDHELEVVGLVRKDFENKKAAVEVKFKSYHLVLDFVHMVQFNFKTSLEQSVAWIDEGGCCFFPEIYTNVDEHHGYLHPKILKDGGHEPQEIKLQIEIELNGIGESKLSEYCGESSPLVKRIKVAQNAEFEDCCDKVSDVRMDEDVGENLDIEKNLDAEVEKAKLDLDPNVVKEMFRKGMESATGTTVVNVLGSSGSMCQGRLELFLKQVEITKKYRGNPNVCYAWLASTKEAASRIMTYGLGHFGFQQIKSIYGMGVHLAAANCADTRLYLFFLLFVFCYMPTNHACICACQVHTSTHIYSHAHTYIRALAFSKMHIIIICLVPERWPLALDAWQYVHFWNLGGYELVFFKQPEEQIWLKVHRRF